MNETPPVTVAMLGPPVARGRTAMIYNWDADHVLKLFWPDRAVHAVEYEAAVARKVHATGLPVPAVGSIVTIEGRTGIIYERVDGTPLLQTLATKPWQMLPVMQQMATLHAAMHSRPAPTLPAQRDRLTHQIKHAAPLTPILRQKALAILEQLPDDAILCHGDFHPGNVLASANGPVIIDWNDATHGNPLADVARTLILLRFGVRPASPLQRWATQLALTVMRTTYLRRYQHLRPVDQRQLQRWQIPIAAARLSENVSGEERYLLRYLERLTTDK